MAYVTPSGLTEEQKRKIIEVLNRSGASQPCPRCRNNNFILLDGYFNQPIQVEFSGMVIGGPTVPSVVTACSKCGFLSQHALGILGLLPPSEGAKQ